MLITGRLKLSVPQSNDLVAGGPADFTQAFQVLDNAVTFSDGPIGNIPTPGLAGRRYYATDIGCELFDTGSAWIQVGTPSPVGTIMQYIGASDPLDAQGVARWLVSDGRSLSRTTYSSLFAIIGTTYGGTGTTFNLPDLRGRVLAGVDGGAGRLHAQALSSVNNQNTLSGTGGVDGYALQDAEMPIHSHGGATTGMSGNNPHAHGVSDPTHNHANFVGDGTAVVSQATPWFGQNFVPQGSGLVCAATVASAGNVGSATAVNPASTGIGVQSTDINHAHGITFDGSSSPHNNMPPYLVVNHIIKVLL